MKTLLSIILILCLAQSLQAQYLKAYTEGKRRETKEQYYDAILAYNAAYNTPDKPATNDLQKRIDFCATQLKKQQDEIKIALKTAKEALKKADEMQCKMETAVFDKAVKERNKAWKGFEGYYYAEYKRTIILGEIDSLNFAGSALLRLPAETAFCKNLKSITLLQNKDIDWKQTFEILKKLPLYDIKVSVFDLDSIPKEYHKLITGIEILETGLKKLPDNLLKNSQLTYLSFHTDADYRNYLRFNDQLSQLVNLQYFDLSYCIDSLSTFIGNLKKLKILDLMANHLQSLPATISELKNLTSLILYYNNLSSLPASIGELKNLTNLNLISNQLTALPEIIGELKNLTNLNLNSNQLTALPEIIGELKNLTSLNLFYNELSRLPSTIGDLKNLLSLDLSSNKLTNLPETIGELKNLTSLDLGYNQLTALPETIGDLKNLTSLDLDHNQLTVLPETIGELKNLTSLDLGYNQLTALPETIGKLKNIVKIDFRSNQLIRLPSTLGELKNLASLDLRNNQLISLPITIGELKNLTNLYLSNNQLTTLPEAIGELKNLISLDLDNNQLTALPETIGELKNLTSLDLGHNQLTTLPETIGKLNKLVNIILTNNQLTSLPKTIGNLISLSNLALNNRVIQSVITNFKNFPKKVIITNTPEFINNDTSYLAIKITDLGYLPQEIGILKNLSVLSINNSQLSSLPETIGELENLTVLDLTNCNLITLPLTITKLKKLQKINIRNNPIVFLPIELKSYLKEKTDLKGKDFESLFNPINRIEIDWINKDMKNLPPEIGKLTNLEFLKLNCNQLSSLPVDIGLLKNLKYLSLSCNFLDSLPSEFGKLVNLTDLDLNSYYTITLEPTIDDNTGGLIEHKILRRSRTLFEKFPHIITKLSNLSRLYMSGNNLTTLPITIKELKNLKAISIKNNPIISLPIELKTFLTGKTDFNADEYELIFNPEKRINIDWSGNNMTILPESISELKNLTSLNLHGTDLTTLPKTLLDLRYLTTLNISYTQIMNSPETLFSLKNLTNLDISHNCLTIFPEAMVKLTNLTNLNMEYNNLTNIPEIIGEFKNLTTLNIQGNYLTTLPERIGELKNLTKLVFDFDSIKSIPISFYNLQVSDNINYAAWFEKCSKQKKYSLARSIRKGIMNKSFKKIDDYAGIAWWCIFAYDFEGAIWAGSKYLEKGGTNIGFISNLALGYLWNGNFEKAKEIYVKYKDQIVDKQKGSAIFLKDIADVEVVKITPKNKEDIEKMKKILCN